MKISDCVWPCRSVAFALVIKNPLNARTFLSKAKLPILVLCALLGKCPVAFIVLLMYFYRAFYSGTILIIPHFFPCQFYVAIVAIAAMSWISSLNTS